MNYRHLYHAGNFADVAKHAALIECLAALQRKDTAFFALDSHAGRAVYDLRSAESRKSGEAERGVLRLLARGASEPALANYFAAIGARAGARLARYPGSAALIAAALRPQDRAILVEAVPAEARAAQRAVRGKPRVRVDVADGYAALKALLPPIERRGLVLIDPPYEVVGEWRTLLRAFMEGYRRWPTGLYLIWYPILDEGQRRTALARLESLRIPKILSAELAIYPDGGATGLIGSGLAIVNPPFGLDARLGEIYAAIHRHLAADGAGYAQVARLTGERMAQ
jgi:23S rRNA (adenine2030-N6)-methyltransferase